MLRRSHKPVLLVVNKVDSFKKFMTDVYEFYNLGIGDPIPVSAASQLGIGDMLDEVVKHFDEDQLEEAEDERPRIAVVGKPNVGKSSIINKLICENRVIVSNVVTPSIRRSSGTRSPMCLSTPQVFAGRTRLKKSWSATVSSVR